ncbi:L-fuco-beta-pyranose dehydrogenase [Corynebacterium xerosis]|nr:L-fuco-beta-pyranose dehydrogenase [Corynebacterium xerosis]
MDAPGLSEETARLQVCCGSPSRAGHAPVGLVEGAARVDDPIVRGEDLYGCFVKDCRPIPW